MNSRRLFEPIAPYSLAVFRIAFGAILLGEIVRFLAAGRVAEQYVAPPFHFRYFGFEWVHPLPEPWLTRLFVVLAALGAMITIGWRTRAAAFLFFLGFGYFFLLEQARYLNHFWLVLLLALLLAWIPTDGAWSVRSIRASPRLAPAWGVLLLRAQLAIVYFFAAVAKLNGDWLRGEPLRSWLRARADLPLIGRFLDEPFAPWLFSYGGLALDLLAAPLLLIRRTRATMFLMLVAFHLLNAALFDIGIFPWLSIAATTIFFEPDWPRRLVGRLRRRPALAEFDATRPVARRWIPLAIHAWLAFQILLPLRHWLYPGDVNWTEEGHRFSWHIKLRSKDGRATFIVTDAATGERRLIDPHVELKDWQYRKMTGRPDMLLQYAHHLAERFTVAGPGPGESRRPEVRAIVDCSLNGRDLQPLIDPAVDLAAQPRTLRHVSWIVPIREALKPAWQSTDLVFEE